MKKTETIFILPQIPHGLSCEEFSDRFMANWEMAATIDYIPDSLKTLKAIDYTQLRTLMNQNDNFFNAAVELCSDLINTMIKNEKEFAKEMYDEDEIDEDELKAIQGVATLDDLLNSGYFCENYESSKGEFINYLLEGYLFNKNIRK